MNAVKASAFICLLCLALIANGSDQVNWNSSAYVKSYLVYQEAIDVNGLIASPEQTQLQNAVRLMFAVQTQAGSDFEVHYDLQPVLQFSSNKNALSSSQENVYRLIDLDATLAESSSTDTSLITYQNLDRFNMQMHFEQGDLTLGRQAMAFGSARFINPSDIFLPFSIGTLNQEYRTGIDGIRYQHYLNDFFSIDSGFILGQDLKVQNNAFFFRTQSSFNGNDLETMVTVLDDANLLGFGLQRALGELGFWFESAYLNNTDHQNNYWRTSTGLDYAFNDKFFAMVEYHYNGAGAKETENYLLNSQSLAYEKYGVHLLGQQYLLPSLTWTANALLSINGSAYINLNDQSALFILSADTSWSDNLYSQLGFYYGFEGKADGEFGGEFSSAPLIVYSSLSFYF